MRKAVFALVTVVALLLLAEVGVTLLSQKGMEKALASQYGLPPSLEVSINSFPFIASLIRNHIGELSLAWEGELEYSVEEGVGEDVAYEARVNLSDVELNMPSLLAGRLEVREISRAKSQLILDADALEAILAVPGGSISMEDDRMFLIVEGEKTQYKVKVIGERTLTLEPLALSKGGEGHAGNPYPPVKTVVIYRPPMDGSMVKASIDRGKVVIDISIPGWEGYL